jgi:SAM-dependent methyltransferase
MTDMTFEDLQDLLWTFAQHRVLTVAARAGVLRRLADGAATSDQIARDLDLEPNATGKTVRALHAMGILTADGDAYRVPESLATHLGPGPGDLTAFIEHSHGMYESWGDHLEPWLHGAEWPSAAADPGSARRFGAAMRAIGAAVAEETASLLDLSHARSMLDVGGGFGQYSKALCAGNPQLHATVLDTPKVAELARAEIAGTDDEKRITFVGGDYLTSDYGQGYDLVLIANVLHQETSDGACEMIRRSAEATAPGGRVAVVDFMIDDQQREVLFGALFAINMRSFGDTYTEPTIRGWMSDAGLDNITRTDISRHKWLITGTKAP